MKPPVQRSWRPPWHPAGSLALRLITGAGLWIAAALVVGGLLLSALFRDYVVRSFDAHLTVRLESLIAVTEIDEEGKVILTRPIGEPRFDQVYSGWYWQISAGKEILLQSRSLWDQTLPRDLSPDGESGGAVRRSDVRGPMAVSLRAVARRTPPPGP